MNHLRHSLLVTASSMSFCLFLAPRLSHAQGLLDPIIVTATRSKTSDSNSAYTSNYLSQDFLRDNFRRNIPDALNFTPGVLSQKTTYGHGSPFIRGQTGRGNLLLFDGVRINNSTWRAGPVQYWNTMDSYAVSHMELVKSQGSVAYGSDAIGGTLNVFGMGSQFRDEADGQFFSHGSNFFEYRTNGEDSMVDRLQGSIGQGGKWGLTAGITYKDFGDIHSSDVGTMKNTGYEETNWDMRFEAALDPSTTITAAFLQLEQDDVWRWHRTVFNPGWTHDGSQAVAGRWLENSYDQDRMLGYIRVASEDPRQGAWLSRWSATLSYQDTSELEFQDRRNVITQNTGNNRYRQWQEADVQTYGLDLEFESPMGPGKLIYGVDYYQDEVDSTARRDEDTDMIDDPLFKASARPVADDSIYSLLGAHAQYHWNVMDDLRVESGLRYTHVEADIGKRFDATQKKDVSSHQSWDQTVFSLRAIQELPHEWSIYGGASQAFRAPNLADLSGATTSRSGIDTSGATDVDPEHYLTYEIGVRQSGKTTNFQASFFYTDIDDIIVDVPKTSPTDQTTQAANSRDGYIYGFEVEGAWQMHEQWMLSGFIAWQKGATDTQAFIGGSLINDPYSRALPLTASMALRWTHPSNKYWIEARVLAAETANRLSAADRLDTQRIPVGGTPSYIVPMIYSGWQATDHLLVTLGLENVTNEDYRHHGSGNNEPGFGAVLGVRTSW